MISMRSMRVHIAVHVAHANALVVHVFGQVFRHLLGQGTVTKRAIAGLARSGAHSAIEVIHLAFHRADFHRRIDQARRADHLLDEDAAACVPAPSCRAWR